MYIHNTAGVDYRPLVRNITLGHVMASDIVQVEVIENNITDGNRLFGLRLVVPEEAQKLGIELGAPSELNITIIDDDGNVTMLYIYTRFRLSLYI